jgi:hypothetical protein
MGGVPVYDITPRHQDLDLPLFGSTCGPAWVITEPDYRTLRDLGRTRIRADLPSALRLDIWKDFKHAGDASTPTTPRRRRQRRRLHRN